MGFPQEEAKSAINVARGDLTLAVEFLYNGIPDNLPEEGEGGQEPVDNVLKTMASIFKISCMNNPAAMTTLLNNLSQTQPELVQLIQQNEEQFRTLISQPISEEDIAAFQRFSQRQGGQGQGSGLGGQGGLGSQGQGQGQQQQQQPGGRGQIRLTKEEFEAVNRLKAFGFSEMDSVQAFFAFDKNEELALNFLFDNKQQEDVNQQSSENQGNTNLNTNNQNQQQNNQQQNKESSEKKDDKPGEEKK